MNQDLQSQIAIVTGGVRGIGLATAQHLAARGCGIILWDIDVAGFDTAGAGFRPLAALKVDVSAPETVHAAVTAAVDHCGRIDILINNAGINGPVVETAAYPPDDWERVLAVNLTGVFHCCRLVVPHMRSRGYGRIVNVASIAGKEGTPGVSAYCASKAGVIGFTKALAREVVTAGITVNAVTPVMAETAIL
jgi:3-oxoacyl-[acyl-carrier protein] reductase